MLHLHLTTLYDKIHNIPHKLKVQGCPYEHTLISTIGEILVIFSVVGITSITSDMGFLGAVIAFLGGFYRVYV